MSKICTKLYLRLFSVESRALTDMLEDFIEYDLLFVLCTIFLFGEPCNECFETRIY